MTEVLAGANPRYVNNGDSIRKNEKRGVSSFVEFDQAMGEPFCDFLNVSYDKELAAVVEDSLKGFFDLLGLTAMGAGNYGAPQGGGSVKVGCRGKVLVVSTSGGVLSRLRDRGLYHDYLAVLSERPHRVSLLHATQDFVVPSPPHAIQRCRDLAYAGELQLTRKAFSQAYVRTYMALAAQGVETGTVYLGSRSNSDVWAKVYDKQAERRGRGFDDPGPLVRVEIAVQSDVGATLRDAAEPGALFWHYAKRLLWGCPVGVRPWASHGEGFVMVQRKAVFTVAQRVEGLLDGSLDVQRLVDLARAGVGGPTGVQPAAEDVLAWLRPFLLARLRQQGLVGHPASDQ